MSNNALHNKISEDDILNKSLKSVYEDFGGDFDKYYNSFPENDCIGLDLRMPKRFNWTEYKESGDLVLHYSTIDLYEECKNKKHLGIINVKQ